VISRSAHPLPKAPWARKEWSLYHPTKISFCANAIASLGPRIKSKSVLFVTSSGWVKRGIEKKIAPVFAEAGASTKNLVLSSSNPSFRDVEKHWIELKDFRPDVVLAIGGGSVLDMAKAFAVLLAAETSDFLQFKTAVKTADKNFNPLPLPMIMLPTTAGTGSEVTPFATIWDDEEKKKYSLSGPRLFPTEAILDAGLTIDLPWEITLSTGLDALSQCLESVWNKNAHPLCLPLAARGVLLAMAGLPRLRQNLGDHLGREQLIEASLLSGLCISQTRTALAHAISYPLTAHYETPHGLACSFTLPALWVLNLKSDDGRLQELCGLMQMDSTEMAANLNHLFTELKFAESFSKTITDQSMVFRLQSEMFTPGRADNNLCPVNDAALGEILKSSLTKLGI